MSETETFELPPGTEVIKEVDESGNRQYRWENGAFMPETVGHMLETVYK